MYRWELRAFSETLSQGLFRLICRPSEAIQKRYTAMRLKFIDILYLTLRGLLRLLTSPDRQVPQAEVSAWYLPEIRKKTAANIRRSPSASI